MPFVLLIALATILLTRDVNRAIALLVVACPCAVVLAGSTAMVAALAVASRLGILIKNTRFLEVLGDVKIVILDKTGTVTLGQLDVVGFHLVGATSKKDLISRAATCAYGSRHPISRAITRECEAEGIGSCEQLDFIDHPGKGMEVRIDGRTVKLGSAGWLRIRAEDQSAIKDHAGPVVWVRQDQELLGASSSLTARDPKQEKRSNLLEIWV